MVNASEILAGQLCTFFSVVLHTTLKAFSVVPDEFFTWRREIGGSTRYCRHNGLREYIDRVVASLHEPIQKQVLRKISILVLESVQASGEAETSTPSIPSPSSSSSIVSFHGDEEDDSLPIVKTTTEEDDGQIAGTEEAVVWDLLGAVTFRFDESWRDEKIAQALLKIMHSEYGEDCKIDDADVFESLLCETSELQRSMQRVLSQILAQAEDSNNAEVGRLRTIRISIELFDPLKPAPEDAPNGGLFCTSALEREAHNRARKGIALNWIAEEEVESWQDAGKETRGLREEEEEEIPFDIKILGTVKAGARKKNLKLLQALLYRRKI